MEEEIAIPLLYPFSCKACESKFHLPSPPGRLSCYPQSTSRSILMTSSRGLAGKERLLQPPPQTKIGKKRGRKPKSLIGQIKRSPVKHIKKSTVSPKKKFTPNFTKGVSSTFESKASSQNSDRGTDSSPLENVQGNMGGFKKVREAPHLCGAVELGEVKALIRAWVSSCSNPDEEDTDIIATYYTSLIVFKDLERLDLLFKYLYRQVLKTQNMLWQSSFNTIVERVQTVMLSHYGATLKVNNFFMDDVYT
ncbi:hypothetical protein SK128_017690 [Halocaridina rubra]|uniref:DNA repair protein Rev1 C-terminal domain-containing protein n=1 Tax=Halocaridina rubra TaxID=373956 RepID=A0AAN8WLI1_HALRR